MQVTGTIIDAETGQPLPGGQIYAADQNGNAVAVARGNEVGSFSLEVPDTSPKIMVVAPGYGAKMIDPGDISSSEPVGLTPMSMSADQPTAVIPNNTASSIPWYVWVAGVGIVVFAAAGSSKNKKIGDASSYIIPIGILGVVAFLLYKAGLFSGTSTGTGSNNAAAAANISQGTTASLASLSQKGINPTLTPAQAASIANTIFSSGSNLNAASVTTIFDLLGQCQNDADIYLIMQSFGTRQVNNSGWLSTCALLNMNCDAVDLEGFVTAVLNQVNAPGNSVSDLNNFLQNNELGATGITYNF
jgi:Carboxypeptidase regulatory-like domain